MILLVDKFLKDVLLSKNDFINYLVIASPRLAINKLQDIVTQGLLRQSFHKKWSFGGRAAVAEASLLLLNDLAKSQTPSR